MMGSKKGSASFLAAIIGWGILALVIFSFIGIIGHGCNWVNRAQDVVMQEVDPGVLLKKYMWFKDASAVLDKKIADLRVYSTRLKSLAKDYEGKSRREWARDDREQYSIWSSEVAGISASYNDLASEYNAAMSKINWRFTNVGQLPAGATEPLPREYKPYQTE